MKLAPIVRLLIVVLVIACGRPEGIPAQGESNPSPFTSSTDPVVRSAAAALAAGRPWRATELLDSASRDSSARTAEVVLLSATAAAAWGGWSRVDRELSTAPWLDSLFDGQGRELLARAALARGVDSLARRHAEASIRSARTDRDRGIRLTLLARALDRQALGDSAAATYLRAARLLPSVADWLQLRAAGTSRDASTRQRAYARIRTPVARARVDPTEAQARERWGDLAGAAQAYAALGQRADALRLRLAANPDEATRVSVKTDVLELLRSNPSAAETRVAVAMMDSALGPIAPDEELIVARAARAAGLLQRAALGYERSDARLDARDRYNYGVVLSRLGRDAAAARELARVPASAPNGADAAYQRARSLLRAGQGAAARTALRRVLTTFPRDTTSAARALFLLADLATDDGRDAAARSAFNDLAHRYPTSNLAPLARFRAAIIAYASGEFTTAARELETLVERYPRSSEVTAARYWAGRARERAGNRSRAQEHWRAVMSTDPLSYYSMKSARRLGVAPWRPQATEDTTTISGELRDAMARAELLEVLGMGTEEGFELDAIASSAGRSPDSLLRAAEALRQRGETSRAITLAQRALVASAPRDMRLFRLLYPVAFADIIRAESEAQGVDPALVAALIHQESRFTPRAVSRAGALGLMQVLPSVGSSLARRARVNGFERVLLFQPDVNIRMGTMHLDAMLDQYPSVEYALAAYNAGGSPVRRWRQKAGTDDPELFIERIPYEETRDYVRILQRNRAAYEMLYGW